MTIAPATQQLIDYYESRITQLEAELVGFPPVEFTPEERQITQKLMSLGPAAPSGFGSPSANLNSVMNKLAAQAARQEKVDALAGVREEIRSLITKLQNLVGAPPPKASARVASRSPSTGAKANFTKGRTGVQVCGPDTNHQPVFGKSYSDVKYNKLQIPPPNHQESARRWFISRGNVCEDLYE